MEELIISKEKIVERLRHEMENPQVVSDHEKLQKAYREYNDKKHELDKLFARWEELEEKMTGD